MSTIPVPDGAYFGITIVDDKLNYRIINGNPEETEALIRALWFAPPFRKLCTDIVRTANKQEK